MSATTTRVVQSSALSRNSAEVFQAADRGAVEITRRDGETLVLMRKSEVERQSTVLRMAADLIAASLGPESEPFASRLQDRFPWMRFLNGPEQEMFAKEIVQSARGCAAVRDFGPFMVDLQEWYATAQAKAAGFTPDDELDWYDELPEATDPRLA
jgi:hypothetical protein